MIIDAHIHVHPEADAYGERWNATPAHLMECLDRVPVDTVTLFPIAAASENVRRTSNEYIAEVCAEYPKRCIGFASVNPMEPGDAPALLEHAVLTLGLSGLKLHPRFMGFRADDPAIVPLVEKAVELDIPIAIDAMLWRPTPLRDQMVINVDVLSKRVPEARIILCHAGGWRFLDALAVVKTNDNVYLDTSVSLEYFAGTPFEDQFIFVLKQAGAGKVIYGSDHPQHPADESYVKAREIFTRHGFTAEEQAMMFGGTFLSILPAGTRERLAR